MIHEEKKEYQCDKCNKTFSLIQNLKRHISTIHEVTAKMFQCTLCEKSFSRKYELMMHINGAHEKIKKFQCDVCSKGFARKDVFKDHIKIHLGKRELCNFCDNAF